MIDEGRLDLAFIGSGATASRWAALASLAREDVSLARLAEAHVDAVQILTDAGRRPAPGALYGVWASDHPRWHLVAHPDADGRLRLEGSKAFCTGAGLADVALVTAHLASLEDGDVGPVLLELPVHDIVDARIDRSGWVTPALADTGTATIDLTDIEVPAADRVGAPGWYLERDGFWDGAVGPAACWAGAAIGLADVAVAQAPSDPHGRAHLGAIVAQAWAMEAALAAAGREMDEREPRRDPRRRALAVRHLVDVACADITERFDRMLGPRPLVGDASVIERQQALTLYRRQCHGERDLQQLGDLIAGTLQGHPDA